MMFLKGKKRSDQEGDMHDSGYWSKSNTDYADTHRFVKNPT